MTVTSPRSTSAMCSARRLARSSSGWSPARPRSPPALDPPQQLGDLQVLGVDRRRSARGRRRARGRGRGTRGCARSGSRRRAPRRRRSSSGRGRSSAQIRQRGPSARLKQTSQRPTFSFTSRIASASARPRRPRRAAGGRRAAARSAGRCPAAARARRRGGRAGPGPPCSSSPGGPRGHRPPRPPVIPPIFEPASSWAARIASLTAARTMSESISASSGSIASGSITILQRQVAAHRHLDHAAAGAGLDRLVLELLLRLAPSRPASAAPASAGRSCRSLLVHLLVPSN